MRRLPLDFRDQYFGCEIELTGINRATAAQTLADLFGTRAEHSGGGYDAYRVKDLDGKEWKIVRDSSIHPECRRRSVLIGETYKVELNSPKLEYSEMEKLQEVVRALRRAGGIVNDSCGMHVHVDASKHTPQSLKNVLSIMYILNPDFRMPEHCGGDRWSILHGDSLQILRQFEPNSFDAIITDPPYASGGSSQTTKNRSTNEKYSSMSKEKALPDFDSDQMDQLSWMFWTAAWLQDARRIVKPGAPVCLFIDWRQLPAMTLALQWAGWTWRGVAVWDKVASRPQKGRFRQQSEYIVWGSNGKMPLERNVGCLPGVFRYPNPQNRIHVTEKPLQLMRDVVQICEPGGRILDPFAGAGTTVLAAVQEGYEAVGIEMSDAYFRRSTERLKTALESEVNQN